MELEDALCLNQLEKQKLEEQRPQVRADEKTGKYPIVRMDLTLFNRRKEMLYLKRSGRLSPESLKHLAEKFGVAEQALYDDLSDRDRWEWAIYEQQIATLELKALLRDIQMAREELMWLMRTAPSGNARVGACAQVINSVKMEVDIRQSLGQLPRVKMEPSVNVEVNVKSEQHMLLKEYAQAIEEAASLNGDFSNVRSGEQVDSGQAAPVDGPKRANS